MRSKVTIACNSDRDDLIKRFLIQRAMKVAANVWELSIKSLEAVAQALCEA